MGKKITVLFHQKKITLMYSLYPFWVSKFKNHFTFSDDLDWVLKKDTNDALLLVGWFSGQDKDGNHKILLERLRQKYRSLNFFDDNDGSESHFLDLMPYIDLYYKKQLFSDKTRYLENFYGNRIFSDFYHREMGILEDPLPLPLPKLSDPKHLEKFRLGWNLAFGQYPISKFKVLLGKNTFKYFGAHLMGFVHNKYPLEKKCPSPTISKCQARFGFKGYRDSVGFQRKLFLDIVKGRQEFLNGMIPLKEYNKEIKNVQTILSPFGWGEVCFRDVEAILNGAVMVKPNMDHIETWPNIYQPDKTYVPILWDGSDLVEKVTLLLDDTEKKQFIRENAWKELMDSRLLLDSKVENMLSEINSFL